MKRSEAYLKWEEWIHENIIEPELCIEDSVVQDYIFNYFDFLMTPPRVEKEITDIYDRHMTLINYKWEDEE